MASYRVEKSKGTVKSSETVDSVQEIDGPSTDTDVQPDCHQSHKETMKIGDLTPNLNEPTTADRQAYTRVYFE